jgi:drug/metabolite transporter (DMT)-like permease
MQPQMRGTIMVAFSGLLFGSMGFLGTKLFYLNFSVENMLFWRFFIATLWIAMSTIRNQPWTLSMMNNPFAILKIFILSTISYSGGSAFYFLASKHIGTGPAMVIFFSFPIFVTLFSWILGTWKINKIALMALFTVMLGLILLKGNGETTLDSMGIFLAIIGACCFAAYIYGSQHTTKNMDSRLLTLLVCFGNTLIFLMLSYYTNSFAVPTTWNAWFYICAIGVVATALPIQLLLDGLKYISPVKASILSVLEPVATIMIGLLLLHETLSNVQALGVVIILLGAIMSVRKTAE